jgi:hypothetical protein
MQQQPRQQQQQRKSEADEPGAALDTDCEVSRMRALNGLPGRGAAVHWR